MVSMILLLLAFVLALIAAWPVPCRWNLVAAALACYFLSLVLAQAHLPLR